MYFYTFYVLVSTGSALNTLLTRKPAAFVRAVVFQRGFSRNSEFHVELGSEDGHKLSALSSSFTFLCTSSYRAIAQETGLGIHSFGMSNW